MPEEKRKLNAWIPVSLYSQLETAGYDNITQALIKALETFFEDTQEDIIGYTQEIQGYKQDMKILTAENNKLKEDIIGYQKDTKGSNKDLERIQEEYKQDITGYKEKIKDLNVEIERLKEVLSNTPDPAELADIKARFDERQRLTEEKDKRIEDLTREVEDLRVFAHYFKNVEVKQIEAPAVEKKKPWYKFW